MDDQSQDQNVESLLSETSGEEGGQESAVGSSGEGQGGQQEQKKEPTADPRLDAIMADIQGLKESNADLRAENAILQGRLMERQQQPAALPTIPEDDEPTEDQLLEDIKKSPTAAIKGITERAVEKAKRELRNEIAKSQQVTTGRSLDEQRAVEDFPELRSNEEFRGRVIQLLNLRKDEQGGYVPGDIYMCAATAHFETQKRQRGVKGGQDMGTIRERVRQAGNAGLGSSGGNGNGERQRNTYPEITDEDNAAIDRVCKKWGISRETYMKRYAGLKKENPHYGTGR